MLFQSLACHNLLDKYQLMLPSHKSLQVFEKKKDDEQISSNTFELSLGWGKKLLIKTNTPYNLLCVLCSS